MYLSDLCSERNAVFTGFVRFPQLYPPKTKTPLDAKVIAPGRGAYPGNKPMALSRLAKVTTGVHFFLTTGFKLTTEGSFPLTTGFKCSWGRVQKWTPHLPTATDFQTGQNANKGFRRQPMCRNPLFSAVFPIFCSFPLYQLSGLHFNIELAVQKTVALCIFFQHGFLCAYAHALVVRAVIFGKPAI